MATIKDIAQLAGVSRGTVDRVLNNRGGVNKETAERILQLADDLDYKPNRAGLVLAARKKNIRLGVILFGKGNPFFDDVVKGIKQKEEELACYNCSITLLWTDVDTNAQLKAIDKLVKSGVSGIAISPTNDPRLAKRINELADAGIPVVTLNTDITGCRRLAFVGSNYFQTGQTAAGLMRLAAGRTKEDQFVGIVSGSDAILCHTQRIEGFRQSIAKDPRFHIVKTIVNDEDDDISYEKTLKLLNDYPQVNALFFAASGIYGGCRAVLSSGRSDDITIITYDAVPSTGELVRSGVISATICQQPVKQGRLPLELLFYYLAVGEKPRQEYYYTTVDIRILENLS